MSSITKANRKLDEMLFDFEELLNVQMLELQYGPNYVSNILDDIIAELSTDKIIGRYEKY